MRLALSQSFFRLGDFENNYKQILKSLKKAKNQADLLLFPEGGLWSYPPKDFLYHKEYFALQNQKIQGIKQQLPKSLSLLLPGFRLENQKIQNGVFLLESHKNPRFFAKEFLADQEVFFESRYFEKGKIRENYFFWNQKRIQILICEDFWRCQRLEKSDLLVVLNASPWTQNKHKLRLKRLQELNQTAQEGSLYLNLVTAQDSLIFDGGSFALNSHGEKLWQGAFFKPDFVMLSLPFKQKKRKKVLSLQAQKEQALLLGIREFFYQTGFSRACLGLSGGIDSALTAYLAVQALGPKNVKAYFLPGPYTQKISFSLVRQLSKNWNLLVSEKDISPLFHFCLKEFFDNKKLKKLSRQNLQSRLRMLFLMLKANENNSLLLGTANKSELATGYSTLYGDLAGALCPIGDLLKGEVYDLASFINRKKGLFPKQLFLREPSAELDYAQKDSNDLPPYPKLDSFLRRLFQNQAPQNKKEQKLLQRVRSQEFKRKQSPPILKLSERDLGESWRYPIAHCFS